MHAPAPKIHRMQDFFDEISEKVVFNCTGLGAKELLGDMDMHPMRGQIVILNKTPIGIIQFWVMTSFIFFQG